MWDTSVRINSISSRIASCTGDVEDRVSLRNKLIRLDNILQHLKDGQENLGPGAISESLDRLAVILDRIHSRLPPRGQVVWVCDGATTQAFIRDIGAEIDLFAKDTTDCKNSNASVQDAARQPHDSQLDRSPFPFMKFISNLKHLPRQGWVDKGVVPRESVAGHSLGLAFLGFLAPESLDRNSCVGIGMIHDLAEAVVGDVTPHEGVTKDQKSAREKAALQYILRHLDPHNPKMADQFMNWWLDYEEGRTPEGKFMKQADKLECIMQSCIYKTTNPVLLLDEFAGLERKIEHDVLKAWLRPLQEDSMTWVVGGNRTLPLVLVGGHLPLSDKQKSNLCQEFKLDCVSWQKLLQEPAVDSKLDIEYLRECQDKNMPQPDPVVAGLLWKKIRRLHEAGARRLLVDGFPSNPNQRKEFLKLVHVSNLALLLGKDDENISSPGSETADHAAHYIQVNHSNPDATYTNMMEELKTVLSDPEGMC